MAATLCKLPTNGLSVFDHYLGLALKGLISLMVASVVVGSGEGGAY